MTYLSFTVLGVPSSLNDWTRKHWRTRNRERLQWAEKVGNVLLSQGLRTGRPAFRVPVRIIFTYHLKGRKRDVDNLVPKHLIDGMCGYVFADDGPDYVQEVTQRVLMGAKRSYTHVLVEPM